MALLRVVAPAAFMFLLGATTVQAQHHQGFWISGGLGGGWNTSAGFEDQRGGGAAYVRMGGTINQHFLIGGEFIGWGRSSGVTVGSGNTTVMAMIYPSKSGGVFLRAGVGLATVRVSTDILGISVSATENGFGLTSGLGYDIRLGSSLYLTPNFDLMVQNYSGGSSTIALVTIGIGGH